MRLGYQQQRVAPWRQEDDWHASGGDAGDAFETDAFFSSRFTHTVWSERQPESRAAADAY
jgi:hypothetical protein